jgi:hypothetical protein
MERLIGKELTTQPQPFFNQNVPLTPSMDREFAKMKLFQGNLSSYPQCYNPNLYPNNINYQRFPPPPSPSGPYQSIPMQSMGMPPQYIAYPNSNTQNFMSCTACAQASTAIVVKCQFCGFIGETMIGFQISTTVWL